MLAPAVELPEPAVPVVPPVEVPEPAAPFDAPATFAEPATLPLPLPAVPFALPALPTVPAPALPAVETAGFPADPAVGTEPAPLAPLFDEPLVPPGLVFDESLPQPARPAATVKPTRASEVGSKRTGSPMLRCEWRERQLPRWTSSIPGFARCQTRSHLIASTTRDRKGKESTQTQSSR